MNLLSETARSGFYVFTLVAVAAQVMGMNDEAFLALVLAISCLAIREITE